MSMIAAALPLVRGYLMAKRNDENASYDTAKWKKIAISSVLGVVIADVLDFSYQTQERMVA